ncbi:ribbon-helix-helix CopG family protein [Rhizobium sp. PP-F2F-G36]|nr:ribbon-helix-helix CopG family protein [Rhizobium sp. PP-F2F-G36]
MTDDSIANMVLRSVYLPQDLDANLRDLAFVEKQSKAELMRQLVLEGLSARGYEMVDGRLTKRDQDSVKIQKQRAVSTEHRTYT